MQPSLFLRLAIYFAKFMFAGVHGFVCLGSLTFKRSAARLLTPIAGSLVLPARLLIKREKPATNLSLLLRESVKLKE
jgi:hypothetical protein